TVELTATRVVAGGDALARAEGGRVVMIEGALPGERVRVEITHDRSDHLLARTIEILEASSDRTVPPCEFARAGCGGCAWQHIAPAAHPALKTDIVRDALRGIAHVAGPRFTPPVVLPSSGYRTTVRALVVGGRAAFRRLHSHAPIAVDACLVAHPLV